MARMYFGFKTNLKDSTEFNATPQVDFIAFENKEKGLILSVGCNDTSDFGIERGIYSAKFKGLECKVETIEDGNLVHDYESISEEDINLLEKSKPYEIGIYFPSAESEIDDPARAEDLAVSIEFKEKVLEYVTKRCDVQEYGENAERAEFDEELS
mgnify:CR=1 FL=1